MDPREQEIKEKWGAIKSQSDEALKQIAKDIYNGLIFTDRHCGNSDVSMVFMVLMFMGPKAPDAPKHPNKNKLAPALRSHKPVVVHFSFFCKK